MATMRTWETICRVVRLETSIYGELAITHDWLQTMVSNFNAEIVGYEVPIDTHYRRTSSYGAAGFVRALKIERERLRALVEWTAHGIKAVTNDGFPYIDINFDGNYRDPELGRQHGPTLLGGYLTTRPFIKRLEPIELWRHRFKEI